jgi:hypothetical protein
MPENPLFRKPSGGLPARGDASAFLNRDFSAPIAAEAVTEAPPSLPPAPPQWPAKVPKERKVPITYKHRERNFTVLKKLSQRLEISIGDLLDEALESKFPEWKAKAAELPPDEF